MGSSNLNFWGNPPKKWSIYIFFLQQPTTAPQTSVFFEEKNKTIQPQGFRTDHSLLWFFPRRLSTTKLGGQSADLCGRIRSRFLFSQGTCFYMFGWGLWKIYAQVLKKIRRCCLLSSWNASLMQPVFVKTRKLSRDWPVSWEKCWSFGAWSKCFLSFKETWNPKQPFINGCFNWMIPNLYIGNGWKSPNIHF